MWENRFEKYEYLMINTRGVKQNQVISKGCLYDNGKKIKYTDSFPEFPNFENNFINNNFKHNYEIDIYNIEKIFNNYNILLKKHCPNLKGEVCIYVNNGYKIYQNSNGLFVVNPENLYSLNFTVWDGNNENIFSKGFGGSFDKNCLLGLEEELIELVEIASTSVEEVIEPGFYSVILDPEAAGIMAHEIIGHSLEADVWLINKKLQSYLKIGAKIAPNFLTVIDNPLLEKAYGTYKYDDEGTLAMSTAIIKNGIINSLLHSNETARVMKTKSTGNARAISSEDPAIVRMSNTYILPGEKSVHEIISKIQKGVFIKGSGNSYGGATCKFQGRVSYLIEKGKISRRLKNVMIYSDILTILSSITNISRDFRIYGGGDGGCGKFGQWPLRVSSGGPYVHLENLYLQ